MGLGQQGLGTGPWIQALAQAEVPEEETWVSAWLVFLAFMFLVRDLLVFYLKASDYAKWGLLSLYKTFNLCNCVWIDHFE